MASKKTKTTSTVTPNAPSWVSPEVQTLSGNTAALAGKDPYSFVAGADPLQTQAAQGASGLTQNTQAYDIANKTLTGMANNGANPYSVATSSAASLLPNLQSYMSPYTDDVVNSSLADYDYGAGQAVGQANLARAQSDTFGGSGGDIQMASTLSGLARGRGTLSSGLRDQAFQSGANLSNLDADRQQQTSLANMAAQNSASQFGLTQAQSAANGLVANDVAHNADQRANLGSQMDMGSILQALAQAKAGAPLTVNSAINGSYGSLVPSNALLTGQTTNATSKTTDLMGSLAKAAQVAATVAAFSDERLKEDIQTIGHDAKGRRWVSYRYLWDKPGTRHEGVIAQEVAKTDPHAVSRHESGYLMVNYGDLA